MKKKVLVISPHPDDETLGAGGTLLKHKSEGDSIYWLIVTQMKEEQGFSREVISRRDKEIDKVKDAYSFSKVFELGLPTSEIDRISYSDLVRQIRDVLLMVKPEILYLPYVGDVHTDHRIIVEATFSSIKRFRAPFINKVLMMEILSETNFAYNSNFFPNLYVDITNFIDRKIEILNIYKPELGAHPFPRSIDSVKALAILRGSESVFLYAEGFMIVREFWG